MLLRSLLISILKNLKSKTMTNEKDFESGDGKTLETVTVTGFLKKHKKPIVAIAIAAIVLVALYYYTKTKTVS